MLESKLKPKSEQWIISFMERSKMRLEQKSLAPQKSTTSISEKLKELDDWGGDRRNTTKTIQQ